VISGLFHSVKAMPLEEDGNDIAGNDHLIRFSLNKQQAKIW